MGADDCVVEPDGDPEEDPLTVDVAEPLAREDVEADTVWVCDCVVVTVLVEECVLDTVDV